jgi:hypothetical protein
MPQVIPKPTAKTRKRAAALEAAEPSRKDLPAEELAISHAGHGIAELAQELADLQRLCTTLANAEGPAERARDEAAAKGCADDEHTACCRSVNNFEVVLRRANAMVDGLEQLILSLEPRTPDETLSLALVLSEELDVFLSHHTKHGDCSVNTESRRLEDALQAVIRGLVYGAGATSPLMAIYSTKAMLTPWYERRAIAIREAARYSVTCDPTEGRLKQVEGQP